LLMKKMSDVQKSNRGRTKTLTDSTRKRHKKEDSAKYNKARVSIGDEYDRWTEPHHPSSDIYSNYHTLLCKLRNCSRFIINHVLMTIPPTDDAKHSNYFHYLQHYSRFLNLAFCSEHFISIKHRILATFNLNKKFNSDSLYVFKVSL